MTTEDRPDLERLLTQKQRDILELLRLGLTDAQIGERTSLTIDGVRYHITEIINKLGVRNRREAAAWPERPPWWAVGLAPASLVWRKASAALPIQASSAALATACAAFALALGGLGFVAYLSYASSSNAGGPGLASAPAVRGTGTPADMNSVAIIGPAEVAEPTIDQTPTPPTSDATPTAPATDLDAPERASLSEPAPLSPPEPPPDPLPTGAPPTPPTPTPDCPFPPVQLGWLFVYFEVDVPLERAREIVESVGGFIVPVDKLLSPIAYPTPLPNSGEYGELVQVPPDRELETMALLGAYPEVTRTERAYWPKCQ